MDNSSPSTQELASQRTDLANQRTAWADDRTLMAGQRTLLANERTYAAWQRTGLVITALGLAAAELLTTSNPQWLLQAFGSLFILLGGLIFAFGFRTHYRMAKRLGAEVPEGMPVWLLGLLTLILLLGTLASLVIVIF